MQTFNIQFTAYGMTKTWPIEAVNVDGAMRLFKDWAKQNKIRATNVKIVN